MVISPSGSQRVVPRPLAEALGIVRDQLEMQVLGPHPLPPDNGKLGAGPGNVFKQALQMILVQAVRLGTASLKDCFCWCGSSDLFTCSSESLSSVILRPAPGDKGAPPTPTATNSVKGRDEGQCWETSGEATSDLLGPAFHLHTFKQGENSQLGGKKEKKRKTLKRELLF